jgi:hypothetical protein
VGSRKPCNEGVSAVPFSLEVTGRHALCGKPFCGFRPPMISGAHVILYSTDAASDREFFRDVLEFPHVDAGAGWLIFALPPSEVAVHPAEQSGSHELYLTCDDLPATIEALREKNVQCSAPVEREWGTLTTISLPSGSQLGLYQPKHPLAHR